MLADWFAQKNKDDMVIFVTIFITSTNQVRSITDNIYLHGMVIIVIFTLDDRQHI